MHQTQWEFRKGSDLIKLPWIKNSVWDVITVQCSVFPLYSVRHLQANGWRNNYIDWFSAEQGYDFWWAEKTIWFSVTQTKEWNIRRGWNAEEFNGICYQKVNTDHRDKPRVRRQPECLISISKAEMSHWMGGWCIKACMAQKVVSSLHHSFSYHQQWHHQWAWESSLKGCALTKSYYKSQFQIDLLLYNRWAVHTGQQTLHKYVLFCQASRWRPIFLNTTLKQNPHKQTPLQSKTITNGHHRDSVFLRACTSHGRGGAVMSLFTQAVRFTWWRRSKTRSSRHLLFCVKTCL